MESGPGWTFDADPKLFKLITVTLEIEAKIPEGAPEQVVRAVTENRRTLNVGRQGFEEQ